jgi:polyisoprenoid-binding protein YceI
MPLMSIVEAVKRHWKWMLVAVPIVVIVAVVGGTFVYVHFVAPDPAPKLAFSSVAAGDTSSPAGDPSATAAGNINGIWKVGSGSQVQYRVQEVLNGQDNEATGATSSVTGQLTVDGTAVSAASFSVDMGSITSQEGQRDSQFRGRIMNTSKFPTATFELTAPISLGSIPDNLTEITVKATGKLTLHGTTKEITFDLKARRNGAHLEVNGTIPITFSDYNINNPSGGPASVGNNGDLEFLLVFGKA